jgi:general secretion pathway protein G
MVEFHVYLAGGQMKRRVKRVLMQTARCCRERDLARQHLAMRSRSSSARGFTLLQVLIVLGIIAVVAGFAVSSYKRGRAAAQQAQCDLHLKAIAVALNAHRQETGYYPDKLAVLHTKQYLQDENFLRCPLDPRPDGSYEEFYVIREPRDSPNLPMVVCPFHERDSHHGLQMYKGNYTTQLATRPALLTGANDATIQSPGKTPIAAKSNTELYGADRIRTGPMGAAVIQFADGSIAEMQDNSDMTVLQSFVEGQASGDMFTLVRQTLGVVTYQVKSGVNTKFDVVTPTAVAGALGTKFRIEVGGNGQMELFVTQGTVALTTQEMTVEAPLNKKIKPGNKGKGRKPRVK